MFDPITNHIEQAQARLLFEYQDAPNLKNLVAAFTQPIQELENAIGDLNNFRSITTAFGQQLDNVGALVGVARAPGQTDGAYLLRIYGQIGVNRSTGLAEDLIAAFLIYTGAANCIVHEYFPGECYIESSYVFPSEQVKQATAAFLQTVVAVGVRFGGFTNVPPVVQFSFDGPQVGDVSAGFGDVNDPTVGGFWADINDDDPDPATI